MKNGLDFTEGPILKKFLSYVVPVMFTSLLQMIYNIADTMIAGKFIGDDALAAGRTDNNDAYVVYGAYCGN